MPFIIILALLIVIYLLFNRSQSNSGGALPESDVTVNQSINTAPTYQGALAYLSKGKLFFKRPASNPEEIHSAYIQGFLDKKEKSQNLHGWKEGTAWGTNHVGKQTVTSDDSQPIKFQSVQTTDDGNLLYFLTGNGFGGLFEYDIASGKELRHLHRQKLDYRDLTYSASRDQILCSSHYTNGIANIVLAKRDGTESREVTGGDTVDSKPSWINPIDNHIVYQSQGQARNDAGYVIAHGPASILMLDLETGELETVLEDDQIDFLCPKVDPQGNLLYIRRPYENAAYSPNQAITDTLFFPFRLLRAVFHFLNFFSLMYSRKPLTSASGPEVKADIKDILLQGKRIDAENALRKGHLLHGVPSLVPAEWQLIKRSKQGQETVLANHVATFDVSRHGDIYYSNGCGVFHLSDAGVTVVHKDKVIEELALA
jgi:hypothetical protein